MYAVSDKYKQAMRTGLLHKSYVKGTITKAGQKLIDVRDNIIIPGTLKYDKRATDSAYNLGSVYIGQLNITLILDENKYTASDLYDATLSLIYVYVFPDKTEEEIPLGSWIVNAVSIKKKLFALTCYDYMCKFDEDIVENISEADIYYVLNYVSKKCGVELAHTAADVSTWVNGSTTLTVLAEDVETYRDILSFIGSITGRFAYIDRSNRLCFRELGTGDVDEEITTHMRMSSQLKEYTTTIRSIHARFVKEKNYVNYNSSVSNSGAKLDIGDIPIVRTSDSNKDEIMSNLAQLLQKVNYYPCDIKMMSDPSFDAGDMLTVYMNDAGTSSVNSLLTHFTWAYHQQQTLSCEGLDARQSNSSKTMSSYSGATGGASIGILPFTNAKEHTLNEELEEEVINTLFGIDDKAAVMSVTVQLTTEEESDIVIRELINGVEMRVFTQHTNAGGNIVTISDYLENTNTAMVLQLLISSTKECIIETGAVRGYVVSSVVSTNVDPWTGVFNISENISRMHCASFLRFRTLNENINTSVKDLSHKFNTTETISRKNYSTFLHFRTLNTNTKITT